MSKSRGFETQKKKNKIKIWKGIWIAVLLVPFLSFFSIFSKVVYADKKDFLNAIFTGNLEVFYKSSFPSYV